jgi:hypothetical protein
MPREPERRPEPAIETTRDPGVAPDWLRGTVSPRDGAAPALLTGHLSGLDDEGRVLFAPEGAATPHAVGIGMDITDGALVRAVRRGARALVARTADPAPRWLLVGLVRERVAAGARDAKPGRLEVAVDGEKVRLEAEHDIELRCGQASITLRYDGRIEVRGTHILSASRGPNRVKGATIALN